MLAFWLNLALLPCAVAFEAMESDHDCCPPTIELQAPDCCELEAVAIDQRDIDDFGIAIVGPQKQRSQLPSVRSTVRHVFRPPDPGAAPPRIHVLNCVYLK